MLFVLSTWELFKPVENFYKSLFEPKLMTIARKQDLGCSGEWQFCSLFYLHLKLQREHKENYMTVEGNKAGTGLQES